MKFAVETVEAPYLLSKGPFFESVTEARHWVINHLDLSLNPSIVKIEE